jgi:hypothetical protein
VEAGSAVDDGAWLERECGDGGARHILRDDLEVDIREERPEVPAVLALPGALVQPLRYAEVDVLVGAGLREVIGAVGIVRRVAECVPLVLLPCAALPHVAEALAVQRREE